MFCHLINNNLRKGFLKDKTGVKSAFAIQAINAFIVGVIYILLPLLMLEKNISIESMGLIFAILPLVTQTNRLLFGIVSDYTGRKKFYWLNGVMNITFLAVYYFANTPLNFLLGKINEGFRNASLWSVNRAYFMDHTKEEEQALIKLRGINSIFQALGIFSAGYLVTKLFYNKTLTLLMGLSFLIFPFVKMLRETERRQISILAILKALDFRHKSKKFKAFVANFFLIGLAWGFTSGYILPLFLKEVGIKVEYIGLFLGIKIFFSGIFAYTFHAFWSGKKKILIGGLLVSLLLIILPFSNQAGLPWLIMLLGIVTGISIAGRETIFTEVADHNTLGRDIGILMIGTHVGMSIAQALSGFIIISFGFPVLFLASAILYAFFSITAYYQYE